MPFFSQYIAKRRKRARSRYAPSFQSLEERAVLASDWQNPVLAGDVDADGSLSLNDALLVVSDLRTNGNPHQLPSIGSGNQPPPYLDVDGIDGSVSLADALLIISDLREGRLIAPPEATLALALDSGNDPLDLITQYDQLIGQVTKSHFPETRVLAQIDGGSWFQTEINASGGFLISPSLPTDGSADGNHVIDYVVQTLGGSPFRGKVEFTLESFGPDVVPDVPGNQAPIAGDDRYQTNEGTTLIVPLPDLLVNDVDPDLDHLHVLTIQGNDPNSTLTHHDDGSFSYDPALEHDALGLGDWATDTLTYAISDGVGGVSLGEIKIQINGVNDAPIAVADHASTFFDTPVDIDVGANDQDIDGTIDPTSVRLESEASHGSLVLNPESGVFSYTPSNSFSGNDSFTYSVADDQRLRSGVAVVSIVVDHECSPAIDIWYGFDQSFGALGRPQEWVNVLGNVSDPNGIASLSYTLNGSASQPLSVGHDPRRLSGVGDFNIELDADDLLDGANTVTVTAVDRQGCSSRRTIDLEYSHGNEWPLPYSIDWDSADQINDAALVVDGLWAVEPKGVRSIEPGYDRLVNIGDRDWQNYEVTTEVTVHSIPHLPLGDYGNAPGIGLLMRWHGHSETSPHRPGDQPRVGYSPLGSLAWYRYQSQPALELTDSSGRAVARDNSGFRLQTGVTYVFRARVVTTASGHEYTLSVWPKGDSESNATRISTTRPLSEFSSGSFLLVSHKVDATFGEIEVIPITPE